jgi:hypothetical protein
MVGLEKFLDQNPDTAEKPYGDAMAASLSREFPCQAGADVGHGARESTRFAAVAIAPEAVLPAAPSGPVADQPQVQRWKTFRRERMSIHGDLAICDRHASPGRR